MNNLTVLVLAGGSGSRCWPLSTNKILFPFVGKPLFEYSVVRVLPKQTKEVVIVVSPDNYEELRAINVSFPTKIVLQQEAKGMADAVLMAKHEIQTNEVLILIADDIFDPSLPQRVVEVGQSSGAACAIPGWKPSRYFPGGYLRLDGDRVVEIIEKPYPENIPSPFVTISGHYFSDIAKFFAMLKRAQGDLDARYEEALSMLMNEERCVMVPYDGPFASLKYPWHVLDVVEALLREITLSTGEGCDIRSNVVIEGPVYIGNNVKIFEHTKITGPAYVGDNTIIGNNNVIRQSMIGMNCVTGFNTDITRSYIGDSCWFHSNYIGDSVIERNVSMGSGTVLANLRLDEGEIFSTVKGKIISTQRVKLGSIIGKDVRIGVNTSIMPGVKIGKGSFVGAGIMIQADIPDDSFVFEKKEIAIISNQKRASEGREKFKKRL